MDTIPVNIDEEIKMPTGEKLTLSSSPHISNGNTVRGVMLKVIFSLIPAIIAGVWFFGFRALLVILVTTASCIGAEILWCALVKKPVLPTICDCSAAVTGVILALNLPAAIPLYVPVIGAFLAIWLGKQIFGGLGCNPFNPAVVARVGLLIALPAAMTFWTPARGMDQHYPYASVIFGTSGVEKLEKGSLDGITCATPLGIAGTKVKLVSRSLRARRNFTEIDNPACWKRYFLGAKAGCIGETCAIALLLGGMLLIAFRLIDWRVPAAFLGTLFVFTAVIHFFFPGVTPSPIFHLLTGGVLLGAFFMATDMVTTPVTGLGVIVFGCGCGLLTAVIRIWGNYPEGVSFSILLMNALVPLIDRWCARRPFGYVPEKEEM